MLKRLFFLVVALSFVQPVHGPARAQSPATAELLEANAAALERVRGIFAQQVEVEGEDAETFWRLYDEYRASYDEDRRSFVDELVQYAEAFPNVSDVQVNQFAEALMRMEQARLAARNDLVRRLANETTPAVALRFLRASVVIDSTAMAGVIEAIPAQ